MDKKEKAFKTIYRGIDKLKYLISVKKIEINENDTDHIYVLKKYFDYLYEATNKENKINKGEL